MARGPAVNVNFQADFGPAYNSLAVLDGIQASMNTNIYVTTIISHIQNVLGLRFNTELMIAGRGAPQNFHHIFEWGTLKSGEPIPLWRIRRTGRGKKSSMTADFVQSRRYVPLPQAAIDSGHVEKFSRHYFPYKAIVMETGQTVEFGAKKEGGLLFVPVPTDVDPRGYIMAHGTVGPFQPGGKATTGQFTAFWNRFFSTEAPAIVAVDIIPKAEMMLKQEAELGISKVRRGKFIKMKTAVALRQEGAAVRNAIESKMLSRVQTEWGAEGMFRGERL